MRVGEIDQARALFLGAGPLLRAFGDAVPDWPDAEVRTLLAKFGLTAEHVPPAGGVAVARASARGRRWRCCRPAR